MGHLLGHEPRFASRLILRPFRRKDTSAVHEAVRASLPELAEYLPWAVGYQRSVTAQFIKDSVGAWASGRAFDFAIRDQQDPDRRDGKRLRRDREQQQAQGPGYPGEDHTRMGEFHVNPEQPGEQQECGDRDDERRGEAGRVGSDGDAWLRIDGS